MLTSFISHLLCGWFAFLLPSYNMYKALKHRPVSEPELERWATYWSVIGAVVAIEYVAEWLVSWLPFYWEIKTIFFLFLSLPQTQGSTFIYKDYLELFYRHHESEIDQGIISAQTESVAFFKMHITHLCERVYGVLSKTPLPAHSGTPQDNVTTLGPNPVSALQGLWSTYQPLVAGFVGQTRSVPNTLTPQSEIPPSASTSSTSYPSPSASTHSPNNGYM